MNKVILMGRLTKDAELKFTGGTGKAVTRFTIAVKRYKKGESDFINCVAFDKGAETIAQYTQKGQQVLIEGSIKTGSYEKDGKKVFTTDIVVNNFEFVGSKKETNSESTNNDFMEGIEPTGDEDLPW